MNALGFAGLKKGQKKCGLSQRLPSGEGGASAGLFKEGASFEKNLHDLFDRALFSHNLPGLGGAGFNTAAADRADGQGCGDHHGIVVGAGGHTGVAEDAAVGAGHKVGIACDAFGVVAPSTVQRAPFEEDRGSDSRPIV